jgi:1,4-alpha-glucan branching enzyme
VKRIREIWDEYPDTVGDPNVEFSLKANTTNAVSVIGDFNHWNPTLCPMKQTTNDTWSTALTLRGGKHYYRFVVDGQEILDPDNQRIEDGPNGRSSVIVVQ